MTQQGDDFDELNKTSLGFCVSVLNRAINSEPYSKKKKKGGYLVGDLIIAYFSWVSCSLHDYFLF